MRWAKHSWEVPYLAKKHQMSDTIMQVRGEEEGSSRVGIRTFSTFENPAAEVGEHSGVVVHDVDGLTHDLPALQYLFLLQAGARGG